MLTFSSICDKFVEAHGMKVDLCETDEEAKLKASQLSTLNSQLKYPVVYFKSDTTGEKAYEEFYVPGEKLDMNRFKSLGVIEEVAKRPMNEIDSFFAEMEHIFAKADFTKEEVVQAIKKFIPNFEHEEKGKNLDQKM